MKKYDQAVLATAIAVVFVPIANIRRIHAELEHDLAIAAAEVAGDNPRIILESMKTTADQMITGIDAAIKMFGYKGLTTAYVQQFVELYGVRAVNAGVVTQKMLDELNEKLHASGIEAVAGYFIGLLDVLKGKVGDFKDVISALPGSPAKAYTQITVAGHKLAVAWDHFYQPFYTALRFVQFGVMAIGAEEGRTDRAHQAA